ncbi:hypothetical protein [Pseudalkalibacillus berkeleyi]|uniref:Lipoprotein n=1 Tax=Pseudalkalibacillus berkeleyi TaxID=1069813 RepID=A0ABS9GVG8_9BACL|nr:hypothetical protein [Pseudalkalibacillus berkeleyi]MCF6136689.1 hypothetical protein [Pseudalkalibacillus berkeleyi]
MRVLLKMTMMILILFIVGCSQQTKTKSMKEYIVVEEVESMSMDVLDRSSGKSDDDETIDVFYQLIKNVQLKNATKEESLEMHKASYDADQQSIQGWINPGKDTNVSTFSIFKDGRLSFIKFEDGIGKHQLKISEPSPELYNKLLSYYDQYIEDDSKDIQVLDILENGDGEDREITIEGNFIRSSEDLVPVDEREDEK